jgi:hypothetical protein
MVSQSGSGAWSFRLTCPHGQRVYLMISFDDGSSRLIWLDEVAPMVWQRTLQLEPGVYRFCYYVDDGYTTTFHLPSHCETDGLKAVLRVPYPLGCETDRPEAARPSTAELRQL